MPRAFKVCVKPGCNNLSTRTYCEQHQMEKKETISQYNEGRDKDHKKFYNSKQWKQLRQLAMARDSFLCVQCMNEGTITKGEVVDHIVEMKDAFHLRADLDNLQTLCNACHNVKTSEERKKRSKEG